MTNHEVYQKLRELKYYKLCDSYQKIISNPTLSSKSFNEILMLMLSFEDDLLRTKRIQNLLRMTNLSVPTNLNELEYDPSRNITKAEIENLRYLDFIRNHHNIIITGATGSGKSFIGTALGFEAVKSVYNVVYYRFSILLDSISIKRDKGQYQKFIKKLNKIDLLIIDDFGLSSINIQDSREILEILESRNNKKSTIFLSQFPFEKWYEIFRDPTLADAIIDRIAYNSYKIELKGESMRRKKYNL